MSADNKTIVRRHFEESLNKGHLSTIDEIVAPTFVGHSPLGPDIQGPEGVKQYVTMLHTAFPDWRYTIEELIAEENKVVAVWTGRGMHKGDFGGIGPTGKHVTVTGVGIFRIANNQL